MESRYLDLSGKIVLGEGSVTIRDAVRDVLAKGSNKILLNLADINYIDSSGIRRACQRPDGRFANVSQPMRTPHRAPGEE